VANDFVYSVRNNASLICNPAYGGITFQNNPAGFNPLRQRLRGKCPAEISNRPYSLGFSLTSSSTIGTNAESMLLGLTNIEWVPSFVPKMMMLGSTLLTVNFFPLSMFLKMSPAFIMAFPFLEIV
jgi:hypothetical protein